MILQVSIGLFPAHLYHHILLQAFLTLYLQTLWGSLFLGGGMPLTVTVYTCAPSSAWKSHPHHYTIRS